MRRLFLIFSLVAIGLAAAEPWRVPLELKFPRNSPATQWPMVVGVPFPPGLAGPDLPMSVATDDGPVPSEIEVQAKWPDGSTRWAHVSFTGVRAQARQYFLTPGKPDAGADAIALKQDGDVITVATGGAVYRFADAGFAEVSVDGLPVAGAADFGLTDNQGRQAHLHGVPRIERAGLRHAVIAVEGDYRSGDRRLAVGRIYYHFFAGTSLLRIAHKLIVSEDSNETWFRQIYMTVETAKPETATTTAWFNVGEDPLARQLTLLGADNVLAATMTQRDFPHFGSTASHFELALSGLTSQVLTRGSVAGDWADLSWPEAGITVRLPDLAEQFPKALSASPQQVRVELWSEVDGQALDFRTEAIIPQYFGNDWIPADHGISQIPNTAQGSAKTHDIWFYPHVGGFAEAHLGAVGAGDEIYAVVDPAWVSASGVMDRFLPEDRAQFRETEEAIADFFYRNIAVPEQVFPNTGYLSWGRNPYTTAGWELKDGGWYPQLHRLGRCLEYNYKRGLWTLYARSGDRQYRAHVRRYTRFLHDFTISNWETPLKPLGWFIQGTQWHSPCFWGAFTQEELDQQERAYFISNTSCLGYGTSEDVIQYVYDWYMNSDYHSRDAAQHYKDALVKEMNFDLDKALEVVPSYVILRPFSSAYEIDPDPQLYDYLDRFLTAIVGDGKEVIDRSHAQNYMKDGEIWAAFYHCYVSTGHPLALQAAIGSAERYYRMNRFRFIHRGAATFQCYALAFEATGDRAYLAHLRHAVSNFTETTVTLADRDLDPRDLDRSFTGSWGHSGAMTTAIPVTIGVPVALRVLAENAAVPTPSVPLASKPQPTHKTHLLFKKERPDAGRIDLYVNNVGDAELVPELYDLAGHAVPSEITAHEVHRAGRPRGDASWQHNFNDFFGVADDHHFFRLQVAAAPGIYRLDVGNEVAFTVLYSDMNRFLQVAPDGLPVTAGQDYFFAVPDNTERVEFFAHRPLRVRTPIGTEIATEALGEGRFAFATGGLGGVWSFATGTDKFVDGHPYRTVDTFVRFLNIPNVIAEGDPARIFTVDPSPLKSLVPANLPTAGEAPAFVAGRRGQALLLPRNQLVEVATPASQAPQAEGTIEFWFQPLWSSSDLHLVEPKFSKQYQYLLRYDPITIVHHVYGDHDGRVGRYNYSKLEVHLSKQQGLQVYPVNLFLQAGRWYHLAVTWRVDGADSTLDVYVNGRQKTYYHYKEGISATLTPADLAPPGDRLQFGAAINYGYFRMPGELFDDLRISRTRRYRESFAPPVEPFAADADTFLLLPLDGDLEGLVNGQPVAGRFATGSKF